MAAQKKSDATEEAQEASDSKTDVKTKIQRVAPYPIDCSLVRAEGQPSVPCRIIRLEDYGMIFKSVKQLFRPGDSFTCDFEVPTFKTKVHEIVKVIKTYETMEAYLPKGTKERVMTVEVHFKSISPEAKMSIRNFIAKIGQKKAVTPK